MMFCCRFCTIDAGPPFGDVEIEFHHPPFAPDEICRQRQRQLHSLANERAAIPQEQVLGCLHRDRRGATGCFTFQCIGDDATHLHPVDAVVNAELAILRHHHRSHQIGRYILEGDPLAIIATKKQEIAQHQCRNRMDEAGCVKDDQDIGQYHDDDRNQCDLPPAPPQGLTPSSRTAGRHVLFLPTSFRYDVHA